MAQKVSMVPISAYPAGFWSAFTTASRTELSDYPHVQSELGIIEICKGSQPR